MKYSLILICVIFMIGLVNAIDNTCGTATDSCSIIYQCGTINTTGTYTLNQSFITTITCLTIQADSITLNGNSSSISGDGGATDYGIITPSVSNLTNLTVKNFGNIVNFSIGVFFSWVNNSLIDNNTITANTITAIYGVYTTNGVFNTISNNNINMRNTGSRKDSNGIYLNSNAGRPAGNNNITGNNIVLYSLSGLIYGIYFVNSGGNTSLNNVQSNIININSTVTNTGIYFVNTALGVSNSNIIQSNIININTSLIGMGIYFNSGSGGTQAISNTIYNSTLNIYSSGSSIDYRSWGIRFINADYSNVSLGIINTSAPSAQAGDIYLATNSDNNLFKDMTLLGTNWTAYVLNSGGTNNTFLNVSYNINSEFVGTPGGELTRKWHYQAYVNDTSGNPQNNINVSIYNVSNSFIVNLTTGISGLTPQYSLIEYINNGTRTYQSPYNNTVNGTYYSWNLTIQQNNIQNFIIIAITDCWTFTNHILFIPNSCGLINLDTIINSIRD